MMAHEPRTLGYYASSHWFQGAVVLVLLGLLAFGLLRALDDAKTRAEGQMVRLTLRNMRTGMQFAMGEALMRQRSGEIAAWAGSNPVRWLEREPADYRGECSAEERGKLPAGAWCFEAGRGVLYYRPRSQDRLQGIDDGRACEQLAWRVARVADRAPGGGFVGVRIEDASPCRWVGNGS